VLPAAFFYLHVTREKLQKRLLLEKFACKMLMKLTQFFEHTFKKLDRFKKEKLKMSLEKQSSAYGSWKVIE